jgi:hypothetical protein
MVAINIALIGLLCLTAFDLIRLRLAGVKLYTWLVLSIIGYNVLGALCWFLPGQIGCSVAGATGVGDMGISTFEFALFFIPEGYPVPSLVALRLACRRLARGSQVS